MSQSNTMASRLAVKTAEATFLHILETEFHLPPRTGRALLETAQDLLLGMGDGESVQPGQIRAVVTALAAPFGPKLAASAKTTVVLTLDSGMSKPSCGWWRCTATARGWKCGRRVSRMARGDQARVEILGQRGGNKMRVFWYNSSQVVSWGV